jgi:DnaK suppressor protein
MNKADILILRTALLQRRREILRRLQGLEANWQTLAEREIESEEKAQKADLSSLFEQLDDFERQEIKEIDLAIYKIDEGTYEICDNCGKMISPDRLKTLPTTRFCYQCSKIREKPGLK